MQEPAGTDGEKDATELNGDKESSEKVCVGSFH
jgi:hypothetical protein